MGRWDGFDVAAAANDSSSSWHLVVSFDLLEAFDREVSVGDGALEVEEEGGESSSLML